MAYQVAWTRALILSMGSSTYAFSTIVACYIFGLALGSLAMAPLADRLKSPLRAAGWLEAAIALSALAVVPLFDKLPALVHRLSAAPGVGYSHVLLIEAPCVFGLLIVPTLCMGALMPLVCRIYDPRPESAGGSVGAVYSANTVGTILGSLAAGFVLIPAPLIGAQRTIELASAAGGLIAVAFVLGEPGRRRALSFAAVGLLWIAGVAGASFMRPWSKEQMTSGPFLGRGDLDVKVVEYIEGIDGTVSVSSPGEDRFSLANNGKPDASTELTDMYTQYLMAQVPMTLKPQAKDVCVIGLGSGCTVGALLAHPEVASVDVAEISPDVVRAARHFHKVNNHALDDPRSHIHRADGRNFLLLTNKTFDLIVSEPSNPWVSGIANLFTREFFEIARSRLRPGGMHCQWIHSYTFGPDDFAAILKTLGGTFRHTQLWELGLDDYLVVGSDAPIPIDVEAAYLSWTRGQVPDIVNAIYMNDPMQLANHFLADGRALEPWTADGRTLVDDRPSLEFSAPRYLLGEKDFFLSAKKRLLELGQPPTMVGGPERPLNQEFLSAVEASRQRGLRLCEAYQALYEGDSAEYRRNVRSAATSAANDARVLSQLADSLDGAASSALDDERPAVKKTIRAIAKAVPAFEAFRYADDAASPVLYWPFSRVTRPESRPPFQAAFDQASRLADEDGPSTKSLELAREAYRLAPDNWDATEIVGSLTLAVRGPEEALPYLLKAYAMAPSDPAAAYHLAAAFCARGERDRALDFLEMAVQNGWCDSKDMQSNRLFEAIRETPRFQDLLKRAAGG
ncbi:MAG: fused MFS/spermidine synthase [Candidatus Sumerlaeota bacterium]|nr:fused MFS/spermidine synthase [Candidatus Sumerlaeota bacterium]